MEIDLSTAEKSDKVTWSPDDQDLLHAGRSYSCSFCKRGFSNAQALGGHMNIHRKDRARLREFTSPDNNILSLDITKRDAPAPNPPSPSVDCHDTVLQHELSRDEKDDDHAGDQLRLSLFNETSSSNNDKVESNRVNRHVKRNLQLSHGESLTELDLELRLGPEPHQASKKG